MKKLSFILILCILTFGQYAFSQRLVWERLFELDSQRGSYAQTIGISIADTGRIFQSFTSSRYILSGSYYPQMIFALSGTGIIQDTIINSDTSNGFLTTIDRARKRLWIAYKVEASLSPRLVIQKLNYRGFTIIRKDFNGTNRIDSIPAYINKLLPSSDGGFYMMGNKSRTISGQPTDQWQVSRWDSLGNRKWVKEYLYTYAYGQPQQAEFLPNGNLFVSGWAGPEIMALEIDTATGRAVNRKVFFTHPAPNTGWLTTEVKRCPGGYIVRGTDSRQTTNFKFYLARYTDSLRKVWGGFSDTPTKAVTTLADTSFWVYQRTSVGSIYVRFGADSSIRHSLTISRDQFNGYQTEINHIGHFNDLSAVFGGSTARPGVFNTALYLCKIDSIGTPYNPVYPPVGPVPVATKNRIVEPDLQVFPNPFTRSIRISHKGTMQLLDIHGRKVMAQAVDAGQEVNTGSLPRGMYLLRFTSTAGKGYVRKVVRE